MTLAINHIQGILLHTQTRRPLPGLKVSAWDKDNEVSDQIGVAVTGPNGRFSMACKTGRYADSPLDTLPDVYFLVYQGDRVIHSTESRPIKDYQGGQEVVIEVDLPEGQEPPPPEPEYFVRGTLIDRRTRKPLPGFTIEAWDKDRKRSDQLGRTPSGLDGGFYFQFEPAQFADSPLDRDPDLFFRVFAGESLVHSTEGSPLKNARQVRGLMLEVDLAFDAGDPAPEPAFTRDEALALAGHARRTPGDLRDSDPELYKRLESEAVQSLKKTMTDHFKDASYELRYFIRCLDLSPLAGEGEKPVKDFLSDAISRAAPNAADPGSHGRLSGFAWREGLSRAFAWDGPNNYVAVLQPQAELQTNPLFSSGFRQAGMVQVANLAQLPESKQDLLEQRGISLDKIRAEEMSALVEEGVLEPEEAQRLRFNANLYQLSEVNLDLVNALRNLPGGHPPASLRDMAQRLKRSDWHTLLEDYHIEPPRQLSRSDYAGILYKRVDRLFPHIAFRGQYSSPDPGKILQDLEVISPLLAHNSQLFNKVPFASLNLAGIDPQDHPLVEGAYSNLEQLAYGYPGLELAAVLKDANLHPQEKLAEVGRRVGRLNDFFRIHPDLPYLKLDYGPDSPDVEQLDLANFSEADRRLILNQLKTDQRMYRLTQDTEDAQRIKESGFHAAHQVAAVAFQTFLKRTGLEEARARRYYRRAQEISAELIARTATLIDYKL